MDVRQEIRTRREAGRELALLVWRFPSPARVIASAPHGGGIGSRRWVVNAAVPGSYRRRDPDRHLATLGVNLGLPGRGVGMLTAVDVRTFTTGADHGVEVVATVGLTHPVLAAAPDDAPGAQVGTINVVAFVPAVLSDAALVNAVATATEAKAQAVQDAGYRATGTPTDAVCIVCTGDGAPAAFGGPRSVWGARLARAVHRAVLAGATA
ncbi:MAG TPA: adenosylcobinamide amidohydrolase [Acidimicrobiales bacterium]|nr:adenosylcobinamide amidohydrolase [Acidimicrobiales bacterium]